MGLPEGHLDPARPSSKAESTKSTLDRSVAPSFGETKEPLENAMAASETHSSTEKAMEQPEQFLDDAVKRERGEPVPDEAEEEEHVYPTSWKLGMITIALCLSVFCMALDNTIISTAIPRITDHFKTIADVGWYGSAYLLATCSTQLIFGKLYTFYSVKWVYLIALFIFEIGSLVCGVAPSSTALVVGRAIAGLGAAGIFSGAILIVADTVPLERRASYTGLIGGMYGLASVAGPLMGGAFTDRLTWRWCFYINLPFGAVTALFIMFFFTAPRKMKKSTIGIKGQIMQFDLYGTALFLPGIVCLLLALQWGGSKYAWSNGRIIALFVLFAVFIAGFVAVQIWRQEKATVPPRVFKNRNVWSPALFIACLGAAFFIFIFYIPIWFQAIKGANAVKSGIMNLPMILGLVVMSIISGALVTIFGYYVPFMYLSSIIMAIGAGLLTTFQTDTDHPKWIGYQLLFGVGVGLGMQQPLMCVQTALPTADVPIGTAIMMFAQTLGGALFISVGQNVFQNQLLKNLAKVVPGLNPAIVLATGATEIKDKIPAQFLPGVLHAYNGALTQTWYVSVAMAALSLLGVFAVEWKSMKGQKVVMAAA